ncbi:calcium-activated chloride channel-domain-containing protein [Talaromyces proteolyticus]|uniref:Calcium-activated chloride channel-domain-containing protein n=1 Tax=Talaromyces proteolyticus TaxID=1131652 RepID=A0AAD4PXS7_9EURO|nr:calcium-activated chloride channel-domain-containing protein [Talaromyces proteolyticus]KAH8693654.1 calcium-activated chloride channel-domain-containing protein [Talaromyces proteolyticus]
MQLLSPPNEESHYPATETTPKTTADTTVDNHGVDWVILYEFTDTDEETAIEEYRSLIQTLDAVGLRTEVRHGNGSSLLIFIKAPNDLVGNWIYMSRVRDWLYGITQIRPAGDSQASIEGETEAEDLRSIYHLVTWQKKDGGAGITPNWGKWENIKASFPLHNQAANQELLRRWSRTTFLTSQDLDAIRALFGEKVAFYFAFTQSYSAFLTFPAVFGVLCWMYYGSYSIVFGLVNCIWSVVFVEYWKLKETDLSIRWGVKSVGALKATRMEYVWDKEVTDPLTGEVRKVFSTRKQVLRQMLQIPFGIMAGIVLGVLVVATFAMEVFISEVYQGPFKTYLDFLPTIVFSLALPTINSKLTSVATRLSKFENHRTEDDYERSQTQKTFVLNFITAFLPIILTAFVYVPFGAQLVPYLDLFRLGVVHSVSSVFRINIQSLGKEWANLDNFAVDPARLRQEVISLTLTAQVLSFGEEMVIPYVKRVLLHKYRDWQTQKTTQQANRTRAYSQATHTLLVDHQDEGPFLTRIRNEAEADVYNVQDDILEMCIQFGYLTLFAVAWPLVPLGFWLNNWLELRGDLFKISTECQRPIPIRADSIGPWLDILSVLSLLGTLSSAAIVHLYRNGDIGIIDLWSLPLTLLITEQAYLAIQYIVRTSLEKIGSDAVRREEARKYILRKKYLETFSEETFQMLSTQRLTPSRPSSSTNTTAATEHPPQHMSSSSATLSVTRSPSTKRLHVRENSNIQRITGDELDVEDHPDLSFKGGLSRTDSGSLSDQYRSMRFWSWHKTSQETIESGMKLIKVMSNLQRSKAWQTRQTSKPMKND